MSSPRSPRISRRRLLAAGLALPLPALVACGQEEAVTSLPPTPGCGEDEHPTLAQTEGPYFKPDSPPRTSFLGDVSGGTRFLLAGSVLTTSCQPVPAALLDVWHADPDGNYDNIGYRLRGHFFSDADGRFVLETVMPGLYPGRTRHFHVKVQAPNAPVLTTQLYFPDEPANARDRIFRPELLMAVRDVRDGTEGSFDFVVVT
ncbi:MAG: intradiol ring-cleavage dioxygenase [Actinomycetota bacterium]|nr:intradiol ring-cleavage dioxygenase [Actinomycetota bacterium]